MSPSSPPHARRTLVLGGARSGKSGYAERLVRAGPEPWTYIATATVTDAEMAERIARHQADRGPGWRTVEAPLDLAAALRAHAAERRGTVVLVANEVGLGIVPGTPMGRAFRDAAGRLNQAVAATADRVVFMAAGLPLTLKGTPEGDA